jgi:hypothetical protein
MNGELDIASGAALGKADKKKNMLANTLRQANGLLGKLKGIAPSSMPSEPENQETIDGIEAGMDALSVASNFDPSGVTKGIVMGNQAIGAIGGIVGGFLPKTESDGAPAFNLENTSKVGLPGLFMDIEAQSTNRRKFYQDKNEKTFKSNLTASNRDTKNRDTLGYTQSVFRHGGGIGSERKECPIEIEDNEVIIRKDNDGKWFIVLETGENTRSHDEEHEVGEEKESGAIVMAKEGDQVFNEDFKDEVIEAVKAGDRKYIERVLIPERDRYKEQMEEDEENDEYSTWEFDYDSPKGKYKKICCGEDHTPVSHKARMARNGMSMRGKRRKDIQRSIGAMKAAAKRKLKYADGGTVGSGDKKKKQATTTVTAPAPAPEVTPAPLTNPLNTQQLSGQALEMEMKKQSKKLQRPVLYDPEKPQQGNYLMPKQQEINKEYKDQAAGKLVVSSILDKVVETPRFVPGLGDFYDTVDWAKNSNKSKVDNKAFALSLLIPGMTKSMMQAGSDALPKDVYDVKNLSPTQKEMLKLHYGKSDWKTGDWYKAWASEGYPNIFRQDLQQMRDARPAFALTPENNPFLPKPTPSLAKTKLKRP